MDLSTFVFYFLSAIIVAFACAVVLVPNPIYAALSLAMCMVSLGFLFFHMEAYFIAGVQLIVYAGAVMVLFVMVLMLFDLKKEVEAVSDNALNLFIKMCCGILFAAGVFTAIRLSISGFQEKKPVMTALEQIQTTKNLAQTLFTKYVFAFELLGVLLLVIAIGVVAVSRTKGGTHARD
jgi:NADH-quinone oxidoreductase subunit J